MSKMSHSSEDHGQTIFVRSFDRLLVTNRAPRLDDSLDTRFGDFFHVIGKWEEGVGSKHSTIKTIFSLINGDTNRGHTVSLTRANTKCHVVVGHDDSV